ncbi:MAG: GTPase HflX [Desulfovibrio sp.]|jgi:GTP-binding protein HflX|nr:GTPase HflX [Desulfovibrio sp.]
MPKLEGNLAGLKKSQLTALQRFFRRRFPRSEVFTQEQARELALLSRSIGRQTGLLIDRAGRVEMAIVGDANSLMIPELPRERSGGGRLRGLRLLHTHLGPQRLSDEDRMDLLFLRLDAIIVLTVDEAGFPMQWEAARLLPGGNETPTLTVGPYPWNQAEADLIADAEALEDELGRTGEGSSKEIGQERALLVSVSEKPRQIQESNLDELAALASTAGLDVAGRMIQRVPSPNPRFILGKGKLAELEVQALSAGADILVFDGELSPAQLHNLADVTERKVLDRTQLILDIFAKHATSRAGKLQVELARLAYVQPRLAGRNRSMDRLAGGIGGRGLGETKLEMDRRKNRERMAHLSRELDDIRRQRAFARGRRARNSMPVAALVGYTNAGKSTLLNRLTNSETIVGDRLFATLDPTTRRLRFPKERELVLADTVGFIRNLPKELLESFKATLEELEAANLLIHVADAGHKDLVQQMEAVETVLEDLELTKIPRILVLNKCDSLTPLQKEELAQAWPRAIQVSAITGEGLQSLLNRLERQLLPDAPQDWGSIPLKSKEE